MSERQNVVIDTDPGIDDAVAILLALNAPALAVRAVTTVAGNIGLDVTTANALKLLAFADRPDIPVHAGAAKPLQRESFGAGDVHGEGGLGGVSFPATAAILAGSHAPAFLADMLLSEPAGSIDVLALGPLTNVALLMRDHPDAAQRIRRIVAMGGAVDEPGNMGPGRRAEFNVFCDPQAADTVLRAGTPLVLIPLDVTRRVRATKADTARFRQSGTSQARATADLIDAYFDATVGHAGGATSRPLHDPCVALYALAPDLFGIETIRLTVRLDGPDAGALERTGDGTDVDVAMRVDAARALERLELGLR